MVPFRLVWSTYALPPYPAWTDEPCRAFEQQSNAPMSFKSSVDRTSRNELDAAAQAAQRQLTAAPAEIVERADNDVGTIPLQSDGEARSDEARAACDEDSH